MLALMPTTNIATYLYSGNVPDEENVSNLRWSSAKIDYCLITKTNTIIYIYTLYKHPKT